MFWTTRPDALLGYQVIDSPPEQQALYPYLASGDPGHDGPRALSDHLPIVVELNPDAL
jgi:hypothetical protein